MPKRTPGLFRRGPIWWIDKVINGQRVQKSTGTGVLREAEQLLAFEIEQSRQSHLYGVSKPRCFKEAATRYLKENQHKRSISRDAQAIKQVMPYIETLELSQVHMGTLEPYIQNRLTAGISQGTINRDLSVIRRILNLAARLWRDENGLAWLQTPPLIQMRDYEARKPYPITFEEQSTLLAELPTHLADMALFKVNTGTRQKEVCYLRWEWEIKDHHAFLIPAEFVKNKLDRLVVCNSVAMAVIDSRRGLHPEWVFTYRDQPVERINNSAWKRARVKIGLPHLRVHDLKHTYGHRLRAAAVSFEDRQDLLGHKSQRITTYYSAPDITRLRAASESVVNMRNEPSLRLVENPYNSPTEHSTLALQSAQVLDLNGGDGWT